MTPEQQRVAIAEACGFIPNTFETPTHDFKGPLLGYKKVGGPNEWVPDYLNDLNAMHEAIMAQHENVRVSVNHTLMEMLRPNDAYVLDRTINATAAQRAEAFLRAIGKWVEA